MTDKEEQMQDAETGRRYKIALEVWEEYIDEWREKVVRAIEEYMHDDSDQLRMWNAELVVIRKFRELANMTIQRGEIAEEEISHGD